MAERNRFSSGTKWEELAGYSRAIRVGNTIHVAGTTSTVNGKIEGVDDSYRQTVIIIEKIKEAIENLGGSLTDIVRTRIYITDISKWEGAAKAHGEYFGDIRPAQSLIGINALVDPDMLIEMEAEAIVDD